MLDKSQQDMVLQLLPTIRPILAHYGADEDMRAEAHLAVCQAVARWREGGKSLPAYARQAVRNRMRDCIRKKVVERAARGPMPFAPASPPDPRAEALAFLDSLSPLSPIQRRVIFCRFVKNMKLSRLAIAEGITVPALCRVIERALKVLHGCWDT